MKKFKQLIINVVEATGAASKAAAIGFRRSLQPAPIKSSTNVVKDIPLSGGGKTIGVFPEDPASPGSGKPYDLETHLNRQSAVRAASDRRQQVKSAAAKEGEARGIAKAKEAAQMAARLASTAQQAKSGSGVISQHKNMKPGETIGVDLVDGDFGYIHKHVNNGKSYFADRNGGRAHEVDSLNPSLHHVTVMSKKGKVAKPIARIHHGDATPVKSGKIDTKSGAFFTGDDINT